MTATLTLPRAAAGATDVSHRASPGARAPAGTITSTLKLRWNFLRGLIFRARRRIGVIGFDDLLHQLVPDDILVVEVDDADAVNLLDYLERLNETGEFRIRQIDLRDVAG